MTVREAIKVLQDLGEENMDKQLLFHDEYRYVDIYEIEIIDKPDVFDYSREPFIGIS